MPSKSEIHEKTAEAFLDELEKLGVRIGKFMPKKPIIGSARRGVAKMLKWLRSKKESGKAVAQA